MVSFKLIIFLKAAPISEDAKRREKYLKTQSRKKVFRFKINLSTNALNRRWYEKVDPVELRRDKQPTP